MTVRLLPMSAVGVGAVALALWVAGCTAQGMAPVVDHSGEDGPARGGRALPKTHVVRPKDTLYSIAYRHELDYRALAAANGIGPPYLIKPGQRLRLAEASPRPEPAAPAAARADAQPVRATPVRINPPPVARAPTPSKPPPATRPPTTAPPPKGKPAVAARPAATAAAAKPAAAKPPAPAKPATPAAPRRGPWLRPVEAKPVRRFGAGSKGFDYELPPATRIRAAVAGVVVYAGPGIGGFRHLVIVKANEDHLVAYGVNVEPLLGEGDRVQAGGAVAEIKGGAKADGRFHFEVRDGGKPVDPGPLIGV